MTIGELADCSGVSTDTIRYYEKRGLLPEPPRDESSGYRLFPADSVQRIRFIRQAQQLGFSLAEIAELLALRADDQATCDQVRQVARRKAEEVRSQIRKLEKILKGLEDLVEICPGDVPSDQCPFITVLNEHE